MDILKFLKNHKGFLIVLLVGSLMWGLLVNTIMVSNNNTRNELIRIETIREEDYYEKVLSNIIRKFETLKVFTETVGIDNLTEENFEEFIQNSDFSDIGFLSCSIAPDGIMEYYYSEYYPAEGIIGLDLINDERDSVGNSIQYAIDYKGVVLNGPVDLVLGTQGIIFRRAIFEDGEFAAIINIVIDYHLLNILFSQKASDVVDIGIYDSNNKLIFGSLEYSENLTHIGDIAIQEVDWKIGARDSKEFNLSNLKIDVIFLLTGNIIYLISITLSILYYRKNIFLIQTQERLINYDNLTQLPNRRRLKKDVNKAIKNNTPFYLGFGDLDNFKNLNDILGHSIGDKFLREITSRINDVLDDRFFVYRWGGDEFIFLIITEDKQIAVDYLEHVYDSFKEPVIINEAKYSIQVSIGVVNYPRHGLTMDDLIKHADIVMYDIKSQNGNHYGFFENHYLDSLQREIDFENKVNGFCIEDFQLYLQPVLDTQTNEIYAFEALSRLFDENGKIINTFEVIKVLERKGDIPKLDRHVFETVCKYSKEIKKETGNDYKFSFNVSPVTLSEEFVDYLQVKLEEFKVNPSSFILEITESFGFKDIDLSIELLKKLKNLGFQIAMDDFGMGYSSLSYIAKLPLDVIKIDQYFIKNYYDNEFERLIIFAIKDISKSLNLKIIVEGIETTKQLDFIKDLKAQYYQGYIHSKAMSLENILKRLREGF